LINGSVAQRIGFAKVFEQKRQIKNHELLVQPCEEAGCHRGEIKGSASDGRKVLRIAAQNCAREDADLDFSAAFLSHEVGKLLRADTHWMVFGEAQTKLQGAVFDFLSVRAQGCHGQHEACKAAQGTAAEYRVLHGFLLGRCECRVRPATAYGDTRALIALGSEDV
jgi:hypothetical protein